MTERAQPSPAGSADELREFVAGCLAGVAVHAENGIGFAALGQDGLLALSLRNATACLQTALSVAGDLAEHRDARARPREQEAA